MSLPLSSNAPVAWSNAGGRYASCVMSSSRVHMSFTGFLTRLRRFDRGGNEVHFQAPAEAAAQERGVHLHLLGIEPGGLGRRGLRDLLNLRGHVDVGAVGAHVGRAVLRLERGVREQRQLVVGAHHARRALDRRGRVAVVARHAAGARGALAQRLRDLRVVERGVRARVPFDGERIARLARAPPGIRDHGDARGGEHHGDDAGHGARLLVVEGLHRSAERRRLRQRGVQHAGQLHVDAVDRRCRPPWPACPCASAPCRSA